MTLTIQLPEEQEAALKAKAAARGVSTEEYARLVLDQDLKAAGQGRRHISEVFREIWGDVPDEVRAQLPADGADQIDHYVYGVPKRSQ
jgi:hypothetical protein